MAQGTYKNLLIGKHTPPKTWELYRPVHFVTKAITQEEIHRLIAIGIDILPMGKISLRRGYHTDLSTIPKPVWALVKSEDIARAAILLDSMYRVLILYFEREEPKEQEMEELKEICDRIFRDALGQSNPPIPGWKRKSIYQIIRNLSKF